MGLLADMKEGTSRLVCISTTADLTYLCILIAVEEGGHVDIEC